MDSGGEASSSNAKKKDGVQNVGANGRQEWVPKNRGSLHPNTNVGLHESFSSSSHNSSATWGKRNRKFQSSAAKDECLNSCSNTGEEILPSNSDVSAGRNFRASDFGAASSNDSLNNSGRMDEETSGTENNPKPGGDGGGRGRGRGRRRGGFASVDDDENLTHQNRSQNGANSDAVDNQRHIGPRARGGFGRNYRRFTGNGNHQVYTNAGSEAPPDLNGDRGRVPNKSSSNYGSCDSEHDPYHSLPLALADGRKSADSTQISSQDWRFHQPTPVIQREQGKLILNRSDIPQLVQEIEEKLKKGRVECMICYDKVGRSAAIWSCASCYSIFHVHCIRKWARAPISADVSGNQGHGQGSNWRCPGCQFVQLSLPEDLHYTCFCGKVRDPDVEHYLVPHSCGGPCGKPLNRASRSTKCPHTCTLQCHPGPCPPCTAMAPPQQCPCGKKTFIKRCSDSTSIESCGQECKKLLKCERHFCEEICHTGPCSPCKILINAACFCGKRNEMVFCGDMEIKGEIVLQNGVFSCDSLCMNKLSCGNHHCGKQCHPGECGECDLSPSKVKFCYCGKTSFDNQRKSCLDPIPTCSGVCDKVLPCGNHKCKSTCHQGDCDPCSVSVVQKCRCGASSRTVPCWKSIETCYGDCQFTCQKHCGKKKNCGRHRCNEKCCPLANVSGSYSGGWDPHLCTVPCGKKLQCGQHVCEELCHKGHCPACLETMFTDLTCACGETSVPPPVPCGTPVPTCSFPCSIPQSCGHEATHNCHFGECPPCTVPVAKECVGSHVTLKNVPCGSRDIRCNNLCGKPRRCGIHACARTCHLPPCETLPAESCSTQTSLSCGQSCGASRRDCKHTCTAPCHPLNPCPDTRCRFPVTITCGCGRITAEVPCDAGGNSMRSDAVLEASVLNRLPTTLQPLASGSIRVPLGNRKLTCNDECAKLDRKKVLADAFGICTTIDVPGVSGLAAELLADLVRREPQWISAVEDRFRYLVTGKSKASSNGLRVHVFSPMPHEKRDILRHLAERWKLSVISAGWEPKRFLVMQATQKSRAPAHSILLKGHISSTQPLPVHFNASVDMDPRLVLGMFDLPREAEVSSLILRFGGECELVWLNDKNALAIFTDPARAATALRRVDHASTYNGALIVSQSIALPGQSAWGTKKDSAALLRKTNTQESIWFDNSWGQDGTSSYAAKPILQIEKPISATENPYGALRDEVDGEGIQAEASRKSMPSGSGSSVHKQNHLIPFPDNSDLDDWENAFE